MAPSGAQGGMGLDLPALRAQLDHPQWENLRRALFDSARINLNPGTLGTPNAACTQAMASFFDGELQAFPLGQYQAGRACLQRARAHAQALFGAPGAAFTAGTTGTVNLLLLALLALPRPQGAPLTVLTSHHEHYGGIAGFERHPAVHMRYLDDSALTDPDAVAAACEGVDVLFLSHVTWTLGEVLPVEAIMGAVARRHPRCLRVLDVAQSLGLLPPPVACADLTIGSGHKWLSLPQGTGFLWASPRARQVLGGLSWSGERLDSAAPEAVWEPGGGQDFSLYAGLEAGLELLATLGQPTLTARCSWLAAGLAQRLRADLSDLGICHSQLPVRGEAAPGMIVLDLHDTDPYAIYSRLNAAGVHLKCVKRTLGNGTTLAALRLGVPFWESPARLESAADRFAEAARAAKAAP